MSDSDATEAPPTPKRNLRTDQEEECEPDRLSIPLPPPTPRRRSPLPSDPYVRIAMYVAMAHAGLALSLALLYGLTKLLEGYWRPIQWAILCSMPLRGLHRALVSFWSDSLALGLFQTLIAVPIAALRTATASIVDSQAVFLCLVRGNRSGEKIGFSKLVQWLISFTLFVIVYENVGLVSLPLLALVSFLVYFTRCRNIIKPGVTKSFSAISSIRRGGRKFLKKNSLCRKISRYITRLMLDRLKTTVGIGLIMFMIMGSVFALLFFSYKIAMEGKDAVISLKSHLNENNYAERIGLKNLMDDNNVPELIDEYMMKFYETVSQNIDSLAVNYNMTEIVDGVKHYLMSPTTSRIISNSTTVSQGVSDLPLSTC
ncbi:hypothetical protein TIFTF001_011799 [Ficus carica]|uniref:Uncharacterized protein n=1 Tax=Ficus carica TaxID=3494 RepID=A0AA87ZYX7_FICCA|nr:hypothetical protein TIFTF001_011799 [Ficus carica]